MAQTLNGSPIDYPTIEINRETYRLKMGNGALLRLKRFGVPLSTLQTLSNSGDLGDHIDILFAVLASMVMVLRDGKWRSPGLSPEEFADMLDDAPEGTLASLAALISDAVGKVSPAAETPSQVAAPAN
jgi:hypothetical protein